jgi:hypothetical protein
MKYNLPWIDLSHICSSYSCCEMKPSAHTSVIRSTQVTDEVNLTSFDSIPYKNLFKAQLHCGHCHCIIGQERPRANAISLTPRTHAHNSTNQRQGNATHQTKGFAHCSVGWRAFPHRRYHRSFFVEYSMGEAEVIAGRALTAVVKGQEDPTAATVLLLDLTKEITVSLPPTC